MKITISKSQWQLIGKKAGWTKTAGKYLVVNNEFNKENYPDLVGKTFNSPPSYAQVVTSENFKKWMDEASDYLDSAEKILAVANEHELVMELQQLNGKILDRKKS